MTLAAESRRLLRILREHLLGPLVPGGDWNNDANTRASLAEDAVVLGPTKADEIHGCSRSTAQRLANELRRPAATNSPHTSSGSSPRTAGCCRRQAAGRWHRPPLIQCRSSP